MLRQGRTWILDYAYVTYWQIHGFLHRMDPAPYLVPSRSGASPVVVIPGVYETWQLMRPVMDYVHGLGHAVHVVEPLGHNVGSVVDMAALVGSYLSEADLTDVTIIAHSKGGLIGKHVMLSADAGPRVRQMVAVCTPFSGSRYARYALTPVIRAFSPRNPVLLALLANLEVNARITSIYGVFDPQIPGGSYLEGSENVQLDVMGHFRILAEESLHQAIRHALRP
ncbi:alpha/beta hydrolase [Paenarthrobacter sp. Z7-10]|nr:alpha/beta hydrolase [Paenarthrobacter sp. Z7-10]